MSWCIPNKDCKYFKRDNKEQEDCCTNPKNKDQLVYLKRCEKQYCPIKLDVHTA